MSEPRRTGWLVETENGKGRLLTDMPAIESRPGDPPDLDELIAAAKAITFRDLANWRCDRMERLIKALEPNQ